MASLKARDDYPEKYISMNGGETMAKKMPDIGDYKYGFHDKDVSISVQNAV